MQTKHSRYYSPYEKAQKERKGNENGKETENWGGTEQYLKPEMEVIEFDNEDVVTASCSYDSGCFSDWE